MYCILYSNMIIYYQVNDGIGDTKLVDKEMKSNSQLSILHKIWKIKRFNYNNI